MILLKKALFYMIVILVSGILIAACTSPPVSHDPNATPEPVMTTVKVAYLPLLSNGPLFIAKEEGYFAQQGINVEFERFQSGQATIPALVNGDIAVSGGAPSPGFFNAIAKGAHVRIVADKGRMAPGSCNANAFMVRKDLYDNGTIREPADLKGRKIMASNDQDFHTLRILAMGNVSTSDVEIVKMDYPSGVIALNNGAVDAGILAEPYISQVLNSGAAVVLVPGSLSSPDFPLPLYYGPAFLDNDPDLGRRFMVAYLKGARQFNEGKTVQNLEILQNYTSLDRDLLKQSCWLPIADDGLVIKQPVVEYLDWLYATKQITTRPGEDQIFDMSYVEYANEVLRNTTDGRNGQK